ncbi:hypothetical protein ACFFRR_002579 [Megaselia abdita]
MKVFIALCVIGLALAVPLEKKWPIPRQDGSVSWLTENEARLEALPELMAFNTKKLDSIKYFLYTPYNLDTAQEIIEGDLESLKKSNFNAKHPTRISVHGWGGKWDNSQNMLIKNSYLKNGRNEVYNVIIVDWSVYSDSSNYYASKSKCSVAGAALGKLIDWMHSEVGLSFASLDLIGHSLGAHVVGFAGKTVTQGKIHTIYGLDPAMPLFSYDNPKTRLASTDANYVETIQTNGGLKGFYSPIGKASFYPNGGKHQPGCGTDVDGACAHARSVTYFAEAVKMGLKNDFLPDKCGSFDLLKENKCDIHVYGIRMADPYNYGRADGVYYLKTNSKAPYGMGVSGE